MPDATLRPATRADVEPVARIWREGWRDGHLGHVPAALVEVRTPESFAQRAADRVADTTVAVINGDIAGFTMVTGDEWNRSTSRGRTAVPGSLHNCSTMRGAPSATPVIRLRGWRSRRATSGPVASTSDADGPTRESSTTRRQPIPAARRCRVTATPRDSAFVALTLCDLRGHFVRAARRCMPATNSGRSLRRRSQPASAAGRHRPRPVLLDRGNDSVGHFVGCAGADSGRQVDLGVGEHACVADGPWEHHRYPHARCV